MSERERERDTATVTILTVLLIEQDLELVGEVVVEGAVHSLHRLLLRQLPVHPRAPADAHPDAL